MTPQPQQPDPGREAWLKWLERRDSLPDPAQEGDAVEERVWTIYKGYIDGTNTDLIDGPETDRIKVVPEHRSSLLAARVEELERLINTTERLRSDYEARYLRCQEALREIVEARDNCGVWTPEMEDAINHARSCLSTESNQPGSEG